MDTFVASMDNVITATPLESAVACKNNNWDDEIGITVSIYITQSGNLPIPGYLFTLNDSAKLLEVHSFVCLFGYFWKGPKFLLCYIYHNYLWDADKL